MSRLEAASSQRRAPCYRVNGSQIRPQEPQTLRAGDIVAFGGAERLKRHGEVVSNPFTFAVVDSFVILASAATRRKRRRVASSARSASPCLLDNGHVQGSAPASPSQASEDDAGPDAALSCSICRDLLVDPIALVPCGAQRIAPSSTARASPQSHPATKCVRSVEPRCTARLCLEATRACLHTASVLRPQHHTPAGRL